MHDDLYWAIEYSIEGDYETRERKQDLIPDDDIMDNLHDIIDNNGSALISLEIRPVPAEDVTKKFFNS